MQASSVGISGFDMFQSFQQGGDPCQFRLKGTFTTSSPACRLNLGSREATGKMEQNIDLERQISGVDNTELTGTSEYHGIWCEKLCYSESHDVKIYQKDKLLTWKDMFFFPEGKLFRMPGDSHQRDHCWKLIKKIVQKGWELQPHNLAVRGSLARFFVFLRVLHRMAGGAPNLIFFFPKSKMFFLFKCPGNRLQTLGLPQVFFPVEKIPATLVNVRSRLKRPYLMAPLLRSVNALWGAVRIRPIQWAMFCGSPWNS